MTAIPAEETDFEIGHFWNCRASITLTLSWVIWHTACSSLRPLPTHQLSLKSEKLCGRTNRCTYGLRYTEAGFIRSTKLYAYRWSLTLTSFLFNDSLWYSFHSFFSSSYAMNCKAPCETPNIPGRSPCKCTRSLINARSSHSAHCVWHMLV